MDLQMGSDDDLFLEDRERSPTKRQGQGWSPRQCEPRWMLNEDRNSDASSTEHAQVLSYQADLLYATKQFADALVIYRKGVATAPMRFVLLRRGFLEGAARCCTNLKDHSEALSFATMLMAESLTIDQRMTAHCLIAFVHAGSGNHLDAINSLQICIQQQRSNPYFWLKLAESYKALQSQHALHRVHTEHAQNHPADSEFINLTGSFQELNRTQCDSSVDCCMQIKDGSVDCSTGPLCYAPRENSARIPDIVENRANENNDKVVLNFQSTKTTGSGCRESGIYVPEFSQMPSRSKTLTESLESSNVSENERCCSTACSSLIGSLLDKLDNLAITERDADTKLRSGDAVPELSCVECLPKLLAASCLLRTRLLLKSVEHSVGSFAKVKNGQLQREIERLLADFQLSPDILGVLHHHARIIFRKGCYRTEADTSTRVEKDSELDEEGTTVETDSSREKFEAQWFPWLSTAWYSSRKFNVC